MSEPNCLFHNELNSFRTESEFLSKTEPKQIYSAHPYYKHRLQKQHLAAAK